MNLLRAASVVSLLTLASRITGLVREQIMASVFGAGALTDAFAVAFRIPNLLRRLFAEGAFSQAFVPLLAHTRAESGDAATKDLVDAVATVLAWALVAVVAIGVAGAPILVWMIGSGLVAFDAGVVMTRIMFPYIGLMSMVALAAGILNTWKHFVVPAATPVLLNLCWIAAAWWLAPAFERWGWPPIYALAVGVMVGGVLQLAVQIPVLRARGMLPRIGLAPGRIRAAWQHPGVKRILRAMGPALLGVSVAQLSLLINTQIATHLGEGSVSWLNYADRLMEFPTALLGVALGVVLTPQLAAAKGRGDDQAYGEMLDWGMRLVVLLAAPAAVALIVFAQPLVAVLYHYGRFEAVDVAQTTRAVICWGVGLLGLVSVKVLAPGFYARQDMRTPVRIAVAVLIATQVANLLLVPWLGFAALALSIGLGATANAFWLLRGLKKAGAYRAGAGWPGLSLRVALACAVMGAFLFWAAGHWDWLALRQQPLQRLGLLAGCIGVAILLYFASLLLLRVPLRSLLRRSA